MSTRNWAADHIAALARGETVSFRPRGGSMSGRIEDGQLVTVVPDADPIAVDDIVLVTVGRFTYVHLIKKVLLKHNGPAFFEIGNNRGRINGWASREQIHGKVTRPARRAA